MEKEFYLTSEEIYAGLSKSFNILAYPHEFNSEHKDCKTLIEYRNLKPNELENFNIAFFEITYNESTIKLVKTRKFVSLIKYIHNIDIKLESYGEAGLYISYRNKCQHDIIEPRLAIIYYPTQEEDWGDGPYPCIEWNVTGDIIKKAEKECYDILFYIIQANRQFNIDNIIDFYNQFNRDHNTNIKFWYT